MKKLLERTLSSGEDFVLVTVLEKHGSAPRGEGAVMTVGENRRIEGTVGGGAIEGAAIEKAKECLREKTGGEATYILTDGEAGNLGMVCGGENRLGFFYFDQEDRLRLQEIIAQNCPVVLSLNTTRPLLSRDNPESGVDGKGEEEVFTLFPENHRRVTIFGGGHVGRALAKVVDLLDFDLRVVEDREEFLQKEDFPEHTERVLTDLSRLDLSMDREEYICVMTRGHGFDLEVVEQILPFQPKYLGVIGSRRKSILLKEKLKEKGYSQRLIDGLDAPIGIPIACETPEEIAISIGAKLVDTARRKR